MVKKKATRLQQETVTIAPPNFQTAIFTLTGRTPYVQNKFSQKIIDEMRKKQEGGSTTKKGAKREKKDFKAAYEAAIHRAPAGWAGIPANGLRQAMVDACRAAGYKMTHAKMGFVILEDAFDADKDDMTPLIKITKGKPRYTQSVVRVGKGVADIRPRPCWDPGWEAETRIEFDADMFTLADITNLLMRAGRQVGIGEGRPFSKMSAGLGWGTFDIVTKGKR